MNIGIMNDGHCMELTQEIFEFISPKGVFEWFDLTEGICEGDMTAITCEENDLPPPTPNRPKAPKDRAPENLPPHGFRLPSLRQTSATHVSEQVLATRRSAGVSQTRHQACLSGTPA